MPVLSTFPLHSRDLVVRQAHHEVSLNAPTHLIPRRLSPDLTLGRIPPALTLSLSKGEGGIREIAPLPTSPTRGEVSLHSLCSHRATSTGLHLPLDGGGWEGVACYGRRFE